MDPTDLIEITTDHEHGLSGIAGLIMLASGQLWLFLKMVRKDLNGHIKDGKDRLETAVSKVTELYERSIVADEARTRNVENIDRKVESIDRNVEKLSSRRNSQPQV